MNSKFSSREFQHKINPIAILVLTGVLVAALWWVLLYEQQRNYENVEFHAITDTGNVSRTFEEHVARTFNNIDAVLKVLRQTWSEDRDSFGSKVRIMQAAYDESLLVQIAVIDSDGRLVYSNLNPDVAPIDLSDRAHFKVHSDREADELYISAPVRGRVSKRYSIQLTRRIPLVDGGFGGVLVISLNPSYFSQFFGSLDLGPGGSITLTGSDGIVRARGLGLQLDQEAIGKRIPVDRPFMKPDSPSAGTFRTHSVIDGVDRIISYRRMGEYPMVVAATKVVDEVFEAHTARWQRYVIGAGIVSFLLLASGVWLSWAVHRQYRLKKRLLFANDSLKTLNSVAVQSGTELSDKLYKALELGCRHLGVEHGVVGALGQDGYLVERCYAASSRDLEEGEAIELPIRSTEESGDSDVVVILGGDRPVPGASLVGAKTLKHECYIGIPVWVGEARYGVLGFYSTKPHKKTFDESDREFVRLLGRWIGSSIAEDRVVKKLTAMATTDSLTGAVSRGRFMTVAKDEINRAHRYGRPLSLVLIDLDYFKRVNDRFGHDAGDMTLKHVVNASRELLRTTDIFARLGGEEFAVLMPETLESEAAVVAERLRVKVARSIIDTLGGQVQITISGGVAQLNAGEDFKAVYNRVDAALYRAKSQGRDRIEAGTAPVL